MRVLFITDVMPYPVVSGNRLRVYHLCRQLARSHEVWLVTSVNSPEEMHSDDVQHMRSFCHEVIMAVRDRHSKLEHVPGLLRYALSGKPPELKFEYCENLATEIRRVTAEIDFDIVHIEPSYLALYREALSPDAHHKFVLGYQNIDFNLHKLVAQVETEPATKMRAYLHSIWMRRWEPRYAEHFDRCITCSEIDRQLLLGANPRLRVDVCPNGVDTQEYQLLPEDNDRPSLLFIGSMNYAPCADGAVFFCEAILPHIREKIADVDLWIVGRNPPPSVNQLARDNVHVTGWVDDILPFYRRSTVCVVPLRAGGGTRLKVAEAMALGRAIVSTSIGCEGIDVVDGEHIFIADEAEEFARKTIQLLSDAQLRANMVSRARKLAVEKYDWGALADGLTEIYRELALAGAAQSDRQL
jgi:polysaccharide biosynthesis protein PslH